MSRARPVVLTGMIDRWPARTKWSLDYLRATYGDAAVAVARIESGEVVIDARGVVQDATTLGQFLAALQKGNCRGYLTSRLDDLPDALRAESGEPPYCEGAPWRVSKLWISAEGTLSALHWDLADNLHTVITGGKRFTLFAPSDSRCVYPRGLLDGIPNGSWVDVDKPDYARFPLLRRAQPFVADLGPGDALYLPRSWWHHVRSTADSVTINTWWAKGARYPIVLAADLAKRVRGVSR